MGVEYQQGEKNLRDLINWYFNDVTEQTRNEATTRLHLIDRLLFECLGWNREDCRAEERINGQYIDYALYCPGCLFIVEAKREGVYFELPVGTDNVMYNITFFSRRAKGVGSAIKQAIGYCQSHGVAYGAVCNGHQLIAFIGSRSDGCPPLEGKALVFDSLESMERNFLIAWQCLSKDGVLSRRLSIELQGVVVSPPPEKLSSRIPSYPGFKQRNALQTDLQILSDLFIEDIARLANEEDERDFLKECYCHSGALSQYALISKDILRARYSALFQKVTEGPSTAPATTKKGINPELLGQALSRRPILLIGDIGVGKTMFIKHLYQVEAPDIFEDALVFYVDFGSGPTLAEDLSVFVMDELSKQLLDRYGIDIEARKFAHGVLHGDLKRFEKGIYADIRDSSPETFRKKQVEYVEEKLRNKDEYLRLCLTHISRGQKKQIVVFLDNVDQRPDEFQERVFMIGQSMADKWPVTVFISIRPQTFYRSRISGTLDAYHPRAFTIGPPRVDEVVIKRLRYGISLLDRGIQVGFQGPILVKVESLKNYLVVLAYSFSNNQYLNEFLDNMSGGNIRLALEFVRAFIGSGHVNTEKILSIYRDTGTYLVPPHEFLRAITYGDHEHYSPAASEILNLFDISTADGKEHFLSPILLAQLDRWAQHSTTDGFVSVSDIYTYLQSLGFNPSQIDWAIERLVHRNLIESATKSRESGLYKSTSHYRVTSVGAYYAKRLITQFQYVDAMVVDTPIVDVDMRAEIANVYNIADRLLRAKAFCEYLDSQWSPLEGRQLAFAWPAARKLIDRDIDYITGKILIDEKVIEST
jgi:hypothetical protein